MLTIKKYTPHKIKINKIHSRDIWKYCDDFITEN